MQSVTGNVCSDKRVELGNMFLPIGPLRSSLYSLNFAQTECAALRYSRGVLSPLCF